MREFAGLLKKDHTFSNFFQSPVIQLEAKRELLKKAVLGKKTQSLVRSFITLLIEKGRFLLLESITEAYHTLLNESQHFEEVTITTARPLRAELRTSIEKLLEKKIGEKIVSKVKVNPKFIGGVRVQIRHRLFDGSVAAKLDDLRKQMLGIQ